MECPKEEITMKSLLVVLFVFFCSFVFSQDLFFQQAGFESASVGYIVCDVETGEIVCERNSK